MRRPAVLAGVVALLGVLVVLGAAATRETERAFTLGVAPQTPFVEIRVGEEMCQTPVEVPPGGAFDRVRVALGTFAAKGGGPQVDVEVRRSSDYEVLARGRIPAGYGDIAEEGSEVARLDRTVADGEILDICLINKGDRWVAPFGSAAAAARRSGIKRDGAPIDNDMYMVFERDARSVLSLVPEMFERASLFRAAWMGAWTVWLLAALVLLGIPWLLYRAVAGLEER